MCPAKSISPFLFFFKFPFRIAKIHAVHVRKPSSSESPAPVCYVIVSYFWRDLLKRKSHNLVTHVKISNIPTGFIIKEISAVVFSFLLSMYPKLFLFVLFSVWKCCVFFMRTFWLIPTKSEGWSEYIWLCYSHLLVGHLQNVCSLWKEDSVHVPTEMQDRPREAAKAQSRG